MRLEKRGSHLKCKVASKCLDDRERVEVVERNKDGPSLPLLSHEFSVPVKKSPAKKYMIYDKYMVYDIYIYDIYIYILHKRTHFSFSQIFRFFDTQ